MKRLLERLQPLKAAVKSIFFISITVLVVIELVRLKRTITLESLESALAGLSIWHLVLMAIIGLVAVSPMLFYDIILNKELETDYSKSYILETSWAVNTINNLAGFAGLVDVGLRYSFYSEDGQEKTGVKALFSLIALLYVGLIPFKWFGIRCLLVLPSKSRFKKVLVTVIGDFPLSTFYFLCF